MDYNAICKQTNELARKVGAFVRSEGDKLNREDIESKGKNDFVTKIDKASEKLLVEGLLVILPGSGFIAEEGTADFKGEDYAWIIDPIDGTTNFIHGAPPYCISIALQYKGKTCVGVIYEISADECFYAYEGGEAYLNEKEISVSKTAKLSASLLATGFPYTEFGRMEPFMETLQYFFDHSHGVRRLGSAAADLAYVACGRYDGFYEYNLSPWDVAAGAYIVEKAGGSVCDFSGGEDYLFGKEIVASNSKIFVEFKNAVGGIMNNKG